MKMEQFYERFDKECMDIPIFKYFKPFQMFQRISCASNEDTVIIKEKMLKRAELYPEIVELEKQDMRILKQMMEDYLKGKETTIKTVILKGFAKDLGRMIDGKLKDEEAEDIVLEEQETVMEENKNAEVVEEKIEDKNEETAIVEQKQNETAIVEKKLDEQTEMTEQKPDEKVALIEKAKEKDTALLEQKPEEKKAIMESIENSLDNKESEIIKKMKIKMGIL